SSQRSCCPAIGSPLPFMWWRAEAAESQNPRLLEPIRRPRHRRCLLPRNERPRQRGEKLVVARAGLPHHPAIVTRIINSALLLLELLGTIWGLADAECLQPGTHVFPGDAELGVALPG